MRRKRICLFIMVMLILSVMIMTGCTKEETMAPPVAQISVTSSIVKFGESITFSGIDSTDSDGNITSYNWDFGDGNTASGETVTHTYDGVGDYLVKFTVSDNDSLSDTTQVHVKVVLGSIKIEVTASSWIGEPYDIYGAIKQKLEKAGFEVVPEESTDYDATLFVNYNEYKGDPYTPSGYGTDIWCTLMLEDKTQDLIFETNFYATTPSLVTSGTLHSSAVNAFKDKTIFRYVGEITASKFGDASALELLIQTLEDEDENVRAGAAEALGAIGDERAVEPLIQALGDEKSLVRWKAAEALGEIGDERAVEPLIQALKGERTAFVQDAIEEALKKIRGY